MKEARDKIHAHLLNSTTVYIAEMGGQLRSRQILGLVDAIADELADIWGAIFQIIEADKNMTVVAASDGGVGPDEEG
jgi:hypothetical protein